MPQALEAVLLDRDGTIIFDKHYLSDPDGVELLPGAVEGLSVLSWAGLKLFLVSNQSGIGRGLFSEEAYAACHMRLLELLGENHVGLDDALYCPHTPEEPCSCRKPGTGMWETLRARHGLTPGRCAMVGDKEADIRFGKNAGLALTVLVLTGKGEAEAARLGIPKLGPGERFTFLEKNADHPDILARDLESAAAALLMGTRLEGEAENLMADLELPDG